MLGLAAGLALLLLLSVLLGTGGAGKSVSVQSAGQSAGDVGSSSDASGGGPAGEGAAVDDGGGYAEGQGRTSSDEPEPDGQGAPLSSEQVGWTLAHRDDFDSLDHSVWGVYGGRGNGITGPRSRQNTFVQDGTLVLRTAPVDGVWHGAGVSSHPGGWTQMYGKYLVRLRFEPGYGVRAVALLWPTAPWPPEIDFFEVPANVPDRTTGIVANHYVGADGRNTWERAFVQADFTQWHTVGVEWTPTALRFTLDGEVVETMTANVPHEPMWLGLQTAQGDMRQGFVPRPEGPQKVDLLVDWVEVYRYDGLVGDEAG